MLDFTDKLILRNFYKSRELHPLTSAPSWGRVTTFSENGFPVAVTEEFLVEVIHFLLLEEDSARVKNFTVMFMMLMNINHRVIWPTVVAPGRLSLAKGMCCAFGIIWFRRHRLRGQESTFFFHDVLKSRCFWSWLKWMSEERVMEVTVMVNGECAELRSKGSRVMGQNRMKASCNKRVKNCLWFWELWTHGFQSVLTRISWTASSTVMVIYLESAYISCSIIDGIKISLGLILWFTLSKNGNVVIELVFVHQSVDLEEKMVQR